MYVVVNVCTHMCACLFVCMHERERWGVGEGGRERGGVSSACVCLVRSSLLSWFE